MGQDWIPYPDRAGAHHIRVDSRLTLVTLGIVFSTRGPGRRFPDRDSQSCNGVPLSDSDERLIADLHRSGPGVSLEPDCRRSRRTFRANCVQLARAVR